MTYVPVDLKGAKSFTLLPDGQCMTLSESYSSYTPGTLEQGL
jgi:hypothetical protein